MNLPLLWYLQPHVEILSKVWTCDLFAVIFRNDGHSWKVNVFKFGRTSSSLSLYNMSEVNAEIQPHSFTMPLYFPAFPS